MILAASIGLVSLCALFGGISFRRYNFHAVTAASGVAGGALGLLIALWRDRTFQSISLTILMVVFSVTGVEVFAIFFPTLEFMGVPLAQVLNPYRAMLAVLYPDSVQLTGVVRATSVVYIGARLTFAAILVAFGTRMLRVWNPGRNEPRELREGAEEEGIESLIEVAEEPALAMAQTGRATVGAGVGKAASSAAEAGYASGGNVAVANGEPWPVSHPGGPVGPPGNAGPTTGLHVPRRTHRRVAPKPQSYRQAWSNPILWREFMTRAYGAKPLIIKGCYVLLFAPQLLSVPNPETTFRMSATPSPLVSLANRISGAAAMNTPPSNGTIPVGHERPSRNTVRVSKRPSPSRSSSALPATLGVFSGYGYPRIFDDIQLSKHRSKHLPGPQPSARRRRLPDGIRHES